MHAHSNKFLLRCTTLDLEAAESMRCTLSKASCLLLKSLIEGWEVLCGPNIGDCLYLFIFFFLTQQSGPFNQSVSFPGMRKQDKTLQFKNGVLWHDLASKLQLWECKCIWRLMMEDLTAWFSDLILCLFWVSVLYMQIFSLNLSICMLH